MKSYFCCSYSLRSRLHLRNENNRAFNSYLNKYPPKFPSVWEKIQKKIFAQLSLSFCVFLLLGNFPRGNFEGQTRKGWWKTIGNILLKTCTIHFIRDIIKIHIIASNSLFFSGQCEHFWLVDSSGPSSKQGLYNSFMPHATLCFSRHPLIFLSSKNHYFYYHYFLLKLFVSRMWPLPMSSIFYAKLRIITERMHNKINIILSQRGNEKEYKARTKSFFGTLLSNQKMAIFVTCSPEI